MHEVIIDVEKINKFFGDKHVVNDLSLQIKQGEIYGFLGPNGSGKTTSLRIICGLLKASSGQGHCLGYPLNSREIKKHVGYMTQKFSFYDDLSIEENLRFVVRMYGLKKGQQKIDKTLEQLGLLSRKKQLAGELSGGWKQRLALSACLLHEPKLLLLDEPTAGVDPKARREFWSQIQSLSEQGITTFISTHYMDEAERCSQLAYIAYGKLLCQGTSQDIIDHVGLYTVQISGPDLERIHLYLSQLSSIEQVTRYGQKLHVSGCDEKQLNQTLSQFQGKEPYQITPIAPQLEDAFIHLVQQTSDNF